MSEYYAKIDSPEMEDALKALSRSFDMRWTRAHDDVYWGARTKFDREDAMQAVADVTKQFPGTRIILRGSDGKYLGEHWVMIAAAGSVALDFYRVRTPFEGAMEDPGFLREIFIRADSCKCGEN